MTILTQIEYFLHILESLKPGYLLFFLLGIVWVRYLISIADGALAPSDAVTKREETDPKGKETKDRET